MTSVIGLIVPLNRISSPDPDILVIKNKISFHRTEFGWETVHVYVKRQALKKKTESLITNKRLHLKIYPCLSITQNT